ncbi:hypothetical protein RHMOL_Rhmol10G0222100 [Rhododendron molle]|uniref:Uncharacterized protein n=1 Tax=Rhododendron molle TaxID=49168 RepID=A0ACC0M613_RHOML|nr:hypothetical protein RHMOL_Rhmol10G0222100 [Rhododendron molle]
MSIDKTVGGGDDAFDTFFKATRVGNHAPRVIFRNAAAKIRGGTMDDYNFSISNSWSFENDVRSGENISHNSRDYTPEFTTNQNSLLKHIN